MPSSSWGIGFLNSAVFNSFHNRVEFGMILEGLPPKPPLGTPLLNIYLSSLFSSVFLWLVTIRPTPIYPHLSLCFSFLRVTSGSNYIILYANPIPSILFKCPSHHNRFVFSSVISNIFFVNPQLLQSI